MVLRKVIAPKGRIPRTANLAQLTYLVMALVNGDDGVIMMVLDLGLYLFYPPCHIVVV